ncbi:hypothetical protein, partial [Pseudomonas putida]|uniref:hypothetical protein n=4 Tax=Pseudomonas TaxID=286 RepID=UPI001F42FACB
FAFNTESCRCLENCNLPRLHDKLIGASLGSTAYFTPYVASDGTVRLTMDVNYVHLADMGTDKAGGLVVDYPRTDGYRLSITDVIPSGGKARI